MGSRMKVLIILLFIGITGSLFLSKKWKDISAKKMNFLAEKKELIVEDEEAESNKTLSDEKSLEEEKSELTMEKSSVFVHVCGAVKFESVYELKEGDRVVDAIKAAGGFLETASTDDINQAELLSDGIRIYIPFKEEDGSRQNEEMKASNSASKVNLNSADKERLMTLPGVGESRALSIIQYRKENGRFKDIKDIMKINGIKENLFNKIKDNITV